MGAGIPMQPGDIAFKCNFATLDPSSGIVVSRRADRKFEDIGPRLCADLNGANGVIIVASAVQDDRNVYQICTLQ